MQGNCPFLKKIFYKVFKTLFFFKVDIHEEKLILKRNNKHEVGVKKLDPKKEIPQDEKDFAADVKRKNLLMFNWTLEEDVDGWFLLKNPKTGYQLEVSECGQTLTYQGRH